MGRIFYHLKIKFFIIACSVLFLQNTFAQLTDLARVEYSFIPKSKSEDQYTRLRFALNYPIKTKEDCYIVVGAEYNSIFLNLEDDYPFDVENLDLVHIVDLNLGYTFKAKKNWRVAFNFNPRIASTLTQSITGDDFFLNGGVFFIKDEKWNTNLKRPYSLILGLTYNATTGIPFPLPFINYSRDIDDKWGFSLGVPKSSLKYYINSKNSLQIFGSLDGYFANVQERFTIDNQSVDRVSLSVLVGGLGYDYKFTKHLVWYLYSGYTFRLNNVLRDEKRNEVFKLDDLNAFYLRTGLKFKI